MPFASFVQEKLLQQGIADVEILSDDFVIATVPAGVSTERVGMFVVGKTPDDQSVFQLRSSPIWLTGQDELDSGVAHLLMRRNAEMLFGRWQVCDWDGEKPYFAVATNLIAATLDHTELLNAIVSLVAERALMGKELQKHSIDF